MPGKGWFFRWHRQAFDLVTRSPEPLAVAAAFALSAGLAEVLIVRLFPDLMVVIVLRSLCIAAGFLVALMIVNRATRLDGHPGLSREDMIESATDVMQVLFAVSMLFFMLAFYSLNRAGAGEALLAGYLTAPLVTQALSVGTEAIAGVMSLAALLNPFWIAAAAGLNMGAFDAALTTLGMFRSMFGVWFVSMIYVMHMGHLISLFPFWISLPGLTFILIWTYVGAREIFGGINQNGMRQTAPKAA